MAEGRDGRPRRQQGHDLARRVEQRVAGADRVGRESVQRQAADDEDRGGSEQRRIQADGLELIDQPRA
jgi:hypothetical protein